jgi:hypothetical protein
MYTVQPSTQPTGFSELQVSKTSSSNKATLAPSDLPTVLSHEPTLSTSAMQRASKDRIVKAASLSLLLLISKQDTVMLELHDMVPARS